MLTHLASLLYTKDKAKTSTNQVSTCQMARYLKAWQTLYKVWSKSACMPIDKCAVPQTFPCHCMHMLNLYHFNYCKQQRLHGMKA